MYSVFPVICTEQIHVRMARRAVVGGKRVGNHVHVDGDVWDGGRWKVIVIEGDEE